MPKESGCRCCGMGCLTLLVFAFLGFIAICVSAWFLGNRFLDKFTSPAPVEIAVQMPSDAEYAAADGKLEQLKTALKAQQAGTFTFTAPELNALLARNPGFAAKKGKTRISIEDSLATMEMSVPLTTVRIGRVQHRWFNGSACFTFLYAAEKGFSFDAKWIEANGHQVSGKFLNLFSSSFDQWFDKDFEDTAEKSGVSEWENVKTMTLEGNQLVVITKGSP
jgi:hypothetical protein